ncbi:MAG: putative membrane protein YdjX (TVP38/TMEM64 family), partial [Gammaproteobacteria bacterium]
MKKIGLVGVLAAIVVLFFVFDLGHYLTLDYIKTQQLHIDQYYSENRILTLILFFIIYVIVTG